MQNALKMSFGITKRAFTIAVVVTTLAWSVAATFAIAPRVASAATPAAGSLVKGSLSAVYYIGSDGKRYVFTNDKEYFTWYSDFSAVQKISDTDLAAIMIGGNVTYKPGVKMVKIQSDPKVYAVAHGGVLRWVSTEAVAVALYGANWNTKIDDISDAFFTNYTVGTQISSASDYVIANEQTNSPTINADKGLANGGALNITLASDNAAGATVTRNAQGINLLKFNIAGAGTITGLTFTRNGAGIAADWANVYIYNGDTRLTTGRSVSSTTNQVVFNNLNIVVSGTTELTLVGDLTQVAPFATVGDAHYFSLAAATSVVATATVGGTFPVSGNLFSISGSNGGSIQADAGSFPSSPSMGQTGATLANFKLSAGGVEDVSLRRLVITNSGAGQLANLANMAITTGGVTVASSPIVSGSTATFVFAVPYVLAKGITRTFSVIGDISAGNRAGVDTFKLYIDQTYDIYATGNTYGAGVGVTNNFDSAHAGDPNSIPAGAALAIIGGQITFVSNGPTTGDVSVGANDAVLYKFAITSVSHVEVHDLRMQINANPALTVTGVLATDDVMSITDCKVINSDTGAALTNSYDLANWTDVGAAHTTFTKIFTDRFEIAAGTTMNMALTCDISSTSPAATKSLTGQINARVGGDIRNLDSNLDVALGDIVPASALTGNPQTIRVSGLTIGIASSPASATVTKGSTVNALGLNLTAGSASDVKVTQMKLRGFISLDDSITYGNTVNSHTMVNGTVGAAAYTAGVQMVTGVVGAQLFVGDHISQAAPAATGIVTVLGAGGNGAGTITINTITGVWHTAEIIVNATHGGATFTPTSVTTSVDAPVAHTVQDVITSATLWDGTTQVGTAQSPDAANGDMNFSNLSLNIPAGTTKTLTVKVILSNNLPYGVGTNRLFIDMIGDNSANHTTANVAAQDSGSNSVNATAAIWNVAGADNLQITTTPSATVPTSAVGTVIVTAVRSGTLTVQLDGDTPVASIVTGSTSDNAVTRVKFNSLNEDFSVTRLTVENTNHASSRSITSVRLFDKNGTLFCSGTLDSNDRLRCANDAGLFTVSGNQVVTIKLNIDQIGSATSGGQPVMALYVNKANGGGGLADDVKAIGISSGTALLDADVKDQGDVGFANAALKVFADGHADPDLISGNVSVLRKTQPTVATVAVSTTLTPTPTVYKFSVTAASNADVALKRFDLAESNVLQATSDYLLYENDTIVPAGQYTIQADEIFVAGARTAGTSIISGSGGNIAAGAAKNVSVTFVTERTIAAGTTKTYRLDCSAAGAAGGHSVTFKLLDDSAAGIVTNNLDTVNVVDNTAGPPATGNHFVWSDTSADTHSSALAAAGGSADWTNGDLVKTLPTISQSLSL